MKTKWLQKNSSKNLTLFCNGWGMDENPLTPICWGEDDVLMLYNYSNLDLRENISQYDEITMICWSFGVFAGSFIGEKLKPTQAIAINGTQYPIEKDYGINPRSYDLTLKKFSETVKNNFIKNMFIDNEYEKFPHPNRTIESQKRELEFFRELAQNPSFNFEFDYAIISKYDNIIPTNNQIKFWKEKRIPCIEIESGHYPFFVLNKIEEITNEKI